MKQEELFVRLSEDMQNFTALIVDAECPFGWNLQKDEQKFMKQGVQLSRSNGVRKDWRLHDLLKPIQGDPAQVKFEIQMIATIVIAGLTNYNIYMPSSDALEGFMTVVGVTAKEMNDYAEFLLDEDLSCLGSYSIKPVTLILHRLLWDAMCEGCGLTGWSWYSYKEEKRDIQEVYDETGKPKEMLPSKKGRSQYVKKGENSAMERLRKAVDYLLEQRVLRMESLKIKEIAIEETDEDWNDTDGNGAECISRPTILVPEIERTKQNAQKDYEDFFFRYALLTCKQIIPMDEVRDVHERIKQENGRMLKDAEKLLRQCIRREQKRKAQLQNAGRVPQMPLHAPMNVPLNIPFNQTGGGMGTAPTFPSNSMFPDLHSLPGSALGSSFPLAAQSDYSDLMFESALRSVIEGDADKFRIIWDALENTKKVSSLQESYLPIEIRIQKYFDAAENYERAVLDSAIACVNEAGLQKADALKNEFGADIAESAFAAILMGDEVYKLRIARYVFADLGQILGLPHLELELPKLDDEDDWDEYCYPSDNGKLAQAIVKDTDIVLYDVLSNMEEKDTDNDERGKSEKAGTGKGNEEVRQKILFPAKLSAVIAQYTGYPLAHELYIRKSHIKAFQELGYSERKARDFAIITGVLCSVKGDDIFLRQRYFYENIDKAITERMEDETSSIPDEVAAALKEKQLAEQQQKAAERESQSLRHEIADMRRKQSDLMKRIKLMEEAIRKRDELIALYEKSADSEEDHADEQEGEDSFPFHTKLRIVLYGGFHVFHQEVMKMLPDIRIVPCASRIDMSAFRNADIIFLQINKTNHSNYWSIVDIAKNMNIPLFHLNYASAKRCAVEMVKEIQKIEHLFEERGIW